MPNYTKIMTEASPGIPHYGTTTDFTERSPRELRSVLSRREPDIVRRESDILLLPNAPAHPPDYLLKSILASVICCLPIGLIALVYSVKTRRFNQAGNYDLALRKSKNVRIFLQLALFVGAILWIMGLIVVAFMCDNP